MLSGKLVQHVQALVADGAKAQAQAALRAALELPGTDIAVLEALAFQAFGLGVHTASREFYHRTTRAAPGDATCWYNLASAERTLGQLEAAEQACNQALQRDPGMTAAALLRSELRRQTPEANHVDQLRQWLARAPDGPAAIALNYALGKELDDLADYDAAFACFARGAALRRAGLTYDVRQDVWKLQRIRETFDGARLGAAPELQPPAFGFIVGMPRSGTTLIERVLTGGAAATSNGETDNLLRALMEGSPAALPDIFERIAAAAPARVAQRYGQFAGVGGNGQIVLEKLPLNYLYLGDLARSFLAYQALVAHWQAVMPEQIQTLSYDAFVADPEPAGQRMAAHMGVPWDAALLRVEANRDSTATASAAQVRRPIYTASSGRWRNYARQLAPLTNAIESAGLAPFG